MNIKALETIVSDVDPRFRVGIFPDIEAEEPDHDGQAHVFEPGREGVKVRHVDYLRREEADQLAEALETGRRTADLEVMARYFRVFYDAVSFKLLEHRGYTYVAITTRGLAKSWGIVDADYDEVADSAAETLAEWRKWADGEVYGYVVAEQVTWHREGRPGIVKRTWEDTEESCWNIVGMDDAEAEARAALRHYVVADRGYQTGYFTNDAGEEFRAERAASLRAAAERLPEHTEGADREGTAIWPERHREVYSLAIEEAQGVLRRWADESEA